MSTAVLLVIGSTGLSHRSFILALALPLDKLCDFVHALNPTGPPLWGFGIGGYLSDFVPEQIYYLC